MPCQKWSNENHPCNLCPSIQHHKVYLSRETFLQSVTRRQGRGQSQILDSTMRKRVDSTTDFNDKEKVWAP